MLENLSISIIRDNRNLVIMKDGKKQGVIKSGTCVILDQDCDNDVSLLFKLPVKQFQIPLVDIKL